MAFPTAVSSYLQFSRTATCGLPLCGSRKKLLAALYNSPMWAIRAQTVDYGLTKKVIFGMMSVGAFSRC